MKTKNVTADFFQQLRTHLNNMIDWTSQKCNSQETVGVSISQNLVNCRPFLLTPLHKMRTSSTMDFTPSDFCCFTWQEA